MRLSVVFVVVAAIVLAVSGVLAAEEAKDSKVLVLTSKTFKDAIAKETMTLVEFYAPWCGHCKALAPEYEVAAKQLEGKNAGALAKVDCTVERELCEQYEVQGFPTLKLFRNDGSTPSDYDSARKADAIVKFMTRQSAPAVAELANVEAVKEFAKDEHVKIVAFVKDGDNVESFTKAATTMRNEFSFGMIKNDEAANTEFKVSTPAVVMFRDFDEGAVTYSGDFSNAVDLATFIRAQSFPLVGVIGPENYAKYLERGFDFVWIFVGPESADHKAMIKDQITPVAATYRDRLSFVQLDGIRWVEHAKSFGLSGNTPAIVLENREHRKNFIFPEDKAVTEAAFREFIDGVLGGTITPHVKSEPEPAENNGPVYVLVGTSFERIVMDNTKDVLVEFYAPWCGHCKQLAPKYDELGKMFKDDATAVIAKVDATANDTPADIQGFPTLILYPAGDKSNPVNYEGERSAAAIAAWFKANGKAGGRPEAGAAAAAASETESAEEEEAAPVGEEEHDHADHEGHDHEHEHEAPHEEL